MEYDKEFEEWELRHIVCTRIDFDEIWKSSAEQARKEAAERAVAFVDNNIMGFADCDVGLLRDLRAAILGDSETVSTDTEKLAIAVKALEVIRDNALNPAHTMTTLGLEQVTDANRAISDRALKEIQGRA